MHARPAKDDGTRLPRPDRASRAEEDASVHALRQLGRTRKAVDAVVLATPEEEHEDHERQTDHDADGARRATKLVLDGGGLLGGRRLLLPRHEVRRGRRGLALPGRRSGGSRRLGGWHCRLYEVTRMAPVEAIRSPFPRDRRVGARTAMSVQSAAD